MRRALLLKRPGAMWLMNKAILLRTVAHGEKLKHKYEILCALILWSRTNRYIAPDHLPRSVTRACDRPHPGRAGVDLDSRLPRAAGRFCDPLRGVRRGPLRRGRYVFGAWSLASREMRGITSPPIAPTAPAGCCTPREAGQISWGSLAASRPRATRNEKTPDRWSLLKHGTFDWNIGDAGIINITFLTLFPLQKKAQFDIFLPVA